MARKPAGPGVSIHGDALAFAGVQRGFAAKTTSAYTSQTGYDWERLVVLSPDGVQAGTLPLTGNRAFDIGGDTAIPVGTQVWIEPDGNAQAYVIVQGGNSTSSTTSRICTVAGWLSDKAALVTGDGTLPKFMQVEIFDGATGGRCDCILSQGQDPADAKYPWLAIYNTTLTKWQLMPIMHTCCGCADMLIDITGPNTIDTVDETMTAVLSVSASCNGGAPYTYDLIFQCPTEECVLFTGAGVDNCDGAPPYPCDNSFKVRICCATCSITTTSCDQCTETCAAGIYWIPNPGFIGPCTSYNRDWYLYRVSDCTWQADFCGIVATMTMTRVGNDSVMDVQFTGGCATIEYKYTETGANLACLGNHTLSKVTVNANSPASIDVKPIVCDTCPDCCNSVFGTPPNYKGITATLSNLGGGCECLVLTEISHTYTPNWKVTYSLTGCVNDTQLVVNCVSGRVTVTIGGGTGYSLTVVSFTCDPFLYVADIVFTSDPTNACPSGNFRITLTP